jgi:HSP20 family protein
MFEPFEEMDKMLEDFPRWPAKTAGFTPAVDIYETKDSVVVEMSLAGVDPDDVDISIEDNVLTIQGKTERKSEVDEKDFYRKEMSYGSFYRTMPLPVAVLGDNAEAKSENGVLKVKVPKAPEAKAKAIKVKVEKK